MLGLQYFTFEELWSPMFFFFMAALVILYFYLAGPWREKHAPEAARVTVTQKCLFVTGMVLYYMAQGGPLELLGHLMFSFHMTNMSLSYLIVPPIIILGIPAFMWRVMFSASFWSRFRWAMNPILSLVLFNMLFSIYHVPVVHDYVMTHFTVHRIYYFAMLVASFMMWWQIVSPIPEWSRLTDVRKMAYVFANGILLTPACALIIFTTSTMYATYNDPEVWAVAMGYCVSGDPSALLASFDGGPSFFNLIKPIEDQQLGGIIMKFVQEIMYGGILAYIFFHWYKREHTDSDDEIPNTGNAGHAGA
ncbi:cytochrome c oxidase assembly factor CtaG [Paenibacillus oenotherae]|uniref:Cytochrome c oxidase assembly factor CtaG n=1 Tax=Paenibacillus oenotherae TaxID=1435645 RepID=A0ABS7DAH7_9BACL|nr:cytochrome c oxidase assembly factor CtaG [Paenibacillus oenotherae]MBW7476890.1 cytochrome c oxidase assembly factor CtaG [Paenibacillus oenotherae]